MNPCCTATLASLRDAADVGALLGLTRQHVWATAHRHGIGTRVGSGPVAVTMYLPEDILELALRTKGSRK